MRELARVDPAMVAAALLLVGVGLTAIYSATRGRLLEAGTPPTLYLKRQAIYAALGLAVGVLLTVVDYRRLKAYAPAVYALSVLLLLLVLTPVGARRLGAQRWIDVGIFQIQPSELAKVSTTLALAAWLADSPPGSRRGLVGAIGLVGLPALLTFFQPDLGTVLVFMAVLVVAVFLWGVRLRTMLLLAVTGLALGLVALRVGLIHDYQLARLRAFLDPSSDPERAGYNLEQSLITIGSGGLTGKGLFRGTQTNLSFVPVQHTDFIFTVIAEEGGFVAAAGVLILFLVLINRVLKATAVARDPFGRLLAGGVAAILAFQLSVNAGMTMGLAPITGIPLPFVSYGGSSMVASFASLGLVGSITAHRLPRRPAGRR